MEAEIEFPHKLRPLFLPKRYKVMYGGRGGAKSWGVARALIIQAAETPMRILCAREVQKSMRDSVHRLLKDQIEAMGYSHFYEVLDTEIRGLNGSMFLFAGLQSHTGDSIKSFEGVDRVWCEEAHSISAKSWDTLIPTIRKADSEIWVTMNPDMDTDDTYVRFIAAPSDDTWLCEVNWRDNPWFPYVLEQERQKALRVSPETYQHIWEGKPNRVADGAIYRHEIEALFNDGRVCNVPYDPLLPVHTVWDLGWNDSMVILMVQRGPMDVRILDYIEDSNRTLDWYIAELNKRAYRWGTDYIPHDGRTRNFQTGKSTEELLRAMGRTVTVLAQTSIEEGIKAARLIFPKCYFDKHKTQRLVECLKRYRRDVNQRTNEPVGPLHDEFSHGCLDGNTLVLTINGNVKIKDVAIGDQVWTPAGYAKVFNCGPTKIASEIVEITMADGSVLLATPEHRIFTTKGVVVADELRYTDSIFTKESSPCVSYQSIKRAGYRDAVIESFKERSTGTGQLEESMDRKLAEKLGCFTLRFTRPFTAALIFARSLIRSMAMCLTPTPAIGLLQGQFAIESTPSKSSMVFAFTGSPRATTRQITTSLAEQQCTDTFGSSTTERYQTDSTSITRMKTKPTTALKTLKCYLPLSIQATIQQVMNGLEAMRIKPKYSPQENWLKSGTQVKKAAIGILNMLSKFGKDANGTNSIASNAAKSSSRHTQQEQSIAMPIAKLKRLEGEQAKRLVYDLTVEKHHCYLANGLLVSNSDAFRYLGQSIGRMASEFSQQSATPPPPPDWRL